MQSHSGSILDLSHFGEVSIDINENQGASNCQIKETLDNNYGIRCLVKILDNDECFDTRNTEFTDPPIEMKINGSVINIDNENQCRFADFTIHEYTSIQLSCQAKLLMDSSIKMKILALENGTLIENETTTAHYLNDKGYFGAKLTLNVENISYFEEIKCEVKDDKTRTVVTKYCSVPG